MNFKDLQFSLGKLSSDVKSHMAKNNPLHKQDTKALSVWIFQERNDLATMRTLAYRRRETTKSFREWATQPDQDDDFTDLQDIGDKLATLLEKANEIEQQYAVHYQQYRQAIKSIREREDLLCDHREKRRSLAARLQHLDKTNPTSPRRQDIETEWIALDNDTRQAEMELGDFKRFALKEAFYSRFNAMVEYADKMKMIAGFGKYIVDLLDVTPTVDNSFKRKPYTSESQSSLILNDCLLALDQWTPCEEDERPTLAFHDDFNDDATFLTEEDIAYYHEQGLLPTTSDQRIYYKTIDEKKQHPSAMEKHNEAQTENVYPNAPPPAYTPPPSSSSADQTANNVDTISTSQDMDYYKMYRTQLTHQSSRRRRSYSDFQQQFNSSSQQLIKQKEG
ncbi:Eisosome component PIL1-domain-containing protein [Halteromyces radiatus]|uniref:Eisosome component PIL1-domain-containing protein n=1 Tax=Halteromyces radiatus TaxID=101107 RepID=UPI00221F3093|nr:Eisosome component PIL1-domain-containing protein [Halteromyces radiatus]KAI8098904.1 Eisosome component PIL1-domain-containing protein [Halteromyces radiatus]